MRDLTQINSPPVSGRTSSCESFVAPRVFWLQGITIAWMAVELGVSVYAAWTAHSAAILAFGADSLVEVLSAILVVMQLVPGFSMPEKKAAQVAGALLFVLALMIATVAAISLIAGIRPAVSEAGIGITIAALIAMPLLARLKRVEARRSKNAVLAADAVQSATCAYLALIALAGLGCNAVWHIAWVDSVAALAATPILIQEGVSAWRGKSCGCC